jgi:peptidoglycan hydrolase-like protein with peptidoglycan-binding domain
MRESNTSPDHPTAAHTHRSSPKRILLMALAGLTLAVGGILITRGHNGSSAASAAAVPSTTPAPPLAPTRLTALPHETITNGTAPLRVRLSGPPVAGSPLPVLRPAIAGKWSTVEDSEIFTPVSTLEPCSTYELTVWAATTATGDSPLGKRRTITLHVACPSTTALQQALARLDYIGARFRSSFGVHIGSGPESRAEAAHRAFHPPHGKLDPDPSDAPPVQDGEMDAVTRGALTVFQEDHGITPSETPESKTWASLLAALTLGHRNPEPYTWVSVSESIPETLEVHRGDHVTLTTPVNTGVAGAETQTGIFPIYSRLTSTTMTGTNPDGTKYSDPGVPWVNYFNGGDAVHGFPRASYGFPQSNGCVELPIATAETVFHMLAIGDIVDVKS